MFYITYNSGCQSLKLLYNGLVTEIGLFINSSKKNLILFFFILKSYILQSQLSTFFVIATNLFLYYCINVSFFHCQTTINTSLF